MVFYCCIALLLKFVISYDKALIFRRKSPNMGRCPNKERCIISYQEVLSSLLKNVNHEADAAVLCNHSINGQLLRTSVLIGLLCFGAL